MGGHAHELGVFEGRKRGTVAHTEHTQFFYHPALCWNKSNLFVFFSPPCLLCAPGGEWIHVQEWVSLLEGLRCSCQEQRHQTWQPLSIFVLGDPLADLKCWTPSPRSVNVLLSCNSSGISSSALLLCLSTLAQIPYLFHEFKYEMQTILGAFSGTWWKLMGKILQNSKESCYR